VPTLARFQQLVAEGRVHYFIGGGTFGAGFIGLGGALGGSLGNATDGAKISAWVQSTFPSRTVGGVTVYDLTKRA